MWTGNTKHSSAGFSLLEVLVAFVVLAMTFTVLFKIFSTGTRNISLSADYSQAMLLAESQLASAGTESRLEPGEQRGEWNGRFRWRLFVEPYQPWEQERQLRANVLAYRVTVEVDWDLGDRRRSIRLSSVRLQNGGSRRQG